MKRVLLTGSTGFVGGALQTVLHRLYSVVATSRLTQTLADGSSTIGVGDLSANTQWMDVLQGIDCVVHLAGRAHKLTDTVADPLSLFRRVNVEGALNLAQQASDAGVKRFVFISSVGVHGSRTLAGSLNELSPMLPRADYAISKMEAEIGLREISEAGGMELVIIRPPLVYGGHAPGNFRLLLKLVASGFPLPFGGVNNQRSMVALGNLIDLILLCMEHPLAANQTFLASDGVDVSTPQVMRYLAAGMEREIRLFSVPNFFMHAGASLVGRQNAYYQLCGSLSIDSGKARDLLGWVPPSTPAQALFKAGQDYISSQIH
ncbi:NAD-dependent epimerase/dehydratase family protein [Pseudomonas sp. B14(2022)]|uniref:NAD-dependent epimerase/dehydratase family protein n=1 Tax=Pseudomonas sp. B14(2022) TaxID=2914043 RepID=UPI001430CBEA|nr:NAD-dependent epimerase/dehydratase family protein [Pseudomonas sp. B14(2022)]NJJ58734.1 NAD-dependent epimerase/dehydratase family protein [Pseudomonas sp. B14(2022)]